MKVLLASDGSEHAMDAAWFLRRIAATTPMEITIVSVSYEPGHPRNSMVQPWYPEWVEREQQRVLEHQRRVERLFAGVCDSVKHVQKFGDPVPCLLDEAKRLEADLIVLGAKGHSAIRRLLLGSTSDSVATHATCSVVVVRGPHHAAGGADSGGVQSARAAENEVSLADDEPLKLLLAYDGSDGSRQAIAEQLELGWGAQTQVELVSVATQAYAFFDDTYAAMAASYEAEEVERVRLEGERMSGEIAQTLPQTTLHVPRANHIGDAIITTAEESQSDLIVVGDAGHSLIGELFLGSTTKYVLRHAPCSVWISRHHRRAAEGTDAADRADVVA